MKPNRKCPWLGKLGRCGEREINSAICGEEATFSPPTPHPKGTAGIWSFRVESWVME